jgi:putative transposase
VGRATLFRKEGDYAAFEKVLQEGLEWQPMRVLAYCVMPNHWHMVLWPRRDGELSEYLRWVTVTHTQRWHAHHHTAGTGPLYQGRFKAFPVQSDEHLLTVCRYVERNALRANLVKRAEAWRWSSLWRRQQEDASWLADLPTPRPRSWLEFVNGAQTEAEVAALRQSGSSAPVCQSRQTVWHGDMDKCHCRGTAFRIIFVSARSAEKEPQVIELGRKRLPTPFLALAQNGLGGEPMNSDEVSLLCKKSYRMMNCCLASTSQRFKAERCRSYLIGQKTASNTRIN